jgi:HAE1 family hydrophobic/amphiphilic exporter-1
MSITEVAIKRPLLIIVIFFTLILFGFICYKSLNYNLLPKFESSVITITTSYRGASPDEVQSSITKPVEDAISSIEGVDHINSSSTEGVSSVVVQLKAGINTLNAQRDAERKLNQIKALFPKDADDPLVNRLNTEELPVLRLSVSAKMSPTELYDLVKQQIKPVLSNVNGVGNINIIGGNEREIQVVFDNDKLSYYKISPLQIDRAIAIANVSYPAGNVESSEGRYSIKMNEKFMSVEALRNLTIVQSTSGGRVLLKDIATVSDAQKEDKMINRINGRPGIGMEIIKQGDANTVSVSELVKQKLEALKTTYSAKELKFEIASDQSIYTLASADAVMHDLFLAVIIVALVMLLFLHSGRSALFVLITLPSAMIPTFILMYAFGFSLNLMTLMALSLVVGILVDDSIVILENIFRHMEMGKDKLKASIEGRAEIGFTAIAITLVDIVVFVPMSIAGGLIGNILREFSLVVVFSTLMSLAVSFTLTPLLASRFAKLPHLDKKKFFDRFFLAFEKIIDSLKEAYGSILAWALGHKKWVIIGVIGLFIASFSLVGAGFIGSAFVSPGDRGEMSVVVELAPGTPLQKTNEAAFIAEKMAMSHPEVLKVFSNVGTASGNASASSNVAELAITLVDKKDREFSTDQFGELLRNEISHIPGVKVTVKATGITGKSDAPIQIALKGTDLTTIWQAAKIVKQVVEKTPGTDYTEFSTKSPQTEIDIKLNLDKMNMVGLSVNDVGSALQLAFRGNNSMKYTDKGEEYTLNIISQKADRKDIESVRNIAIKNSKGSTILLQDIADVNESLGQSIMQRSDRLNSIKITAYSSGRPVGTIISDIKAALEKEKLPGDVIVDFQGTAQQQKAAFGSLGVAMLIGFLLVYLIMVALYESVIYPLVVMFSIPVAIIGALLALALSMESLTIFALVGLIMLMGLVAKNGILLVDFTNHLREKGHSLKDALIEAGKERLRPILMTTVAMIVGMLPIALSNGAGAEVKNGMAWVIIGGLSSSLILTLVVVPTIYYIIDRLKEKTSAFFQRKRAISVVKEIKGNFCEHDVHNGH